MTNYKRGVKKEYDAIKILETAGYDVIRAAGSHGTYDLVAMGPTGVRLIQVKRVKEGNPWRQEYELAKESMQDKPRLPNVSREIWVWEDNNGWIVREVI